MKLVMTAAMRSVASAGNEIVAGLIAAMADAQAQHGVELRSLTQREQTANMWYSLMGTGMNNIIGEYQKWKQQGEDLRVQAKRAMESRFRELLIEAIQIAEEYRADFGAALKPPAGVASFRYKSSGKQKTQNTQKPNGAAKGTTSASAPSIKTNSKTAALQKKLAAAKQKLELAKTNGTPTKNLEDRIYEIEDAIRLATQT